MSPVFRDEELSEYGETVMLRREEMRDAVYDAAMEWWAAREDVIDATDDELCERAANRLTHARERLDLVLEDAHRRAKEGR